jgi:small subunit ribosomal protein S15
MVEVKKQKLEDKYQLSKKDTGSPAVQVLQITARIAELAAHLKAHKHDYDARLGLLKLMAKRRRLLAYLMKFEPNVYTKLIKDLNLKI